MHCALIFHLRLLLVSTQGGEEVMALLACKERPDNEYDVLLYLYGAVCLIATVALLRGSIFASFARLGVDKNSSCTKSIALKPTLILSTADSNVRIISVT